MSPDVATPQCVWFCSNFWSSLLLLGGLKRDRPTTCMVVRHGGDRGSLKAGRQKFEELLFWYCTFLSRPSFGHVSGVPGIRKTPKCRRVCLPKWISLGETGRDTVDLEAWLEVVLVPTASQDAPEVLPCLDDWPIDCGRNSTCHHDHSACAGVCRFVYSKRCNVINPIINHPLNHHCMDGINNPHTVCLWHWVSDIAEKTDG